MSGSDDSPVGLVGRVVHPVPASTDEHRRYGEVVVRIRGGTESYRACSDQALELHATVLVVESLASRVVVVTQWDDEVGLAPAR